MAHPSLRRCNANRRPRIDRRRSASARDSPAPIWPHRSQKISTVAAPACPYTAAGPSSWQAPMQIFITSATGYVGAAVAARLRAHGHSVMALARTSSSEQRLRAAGVQVLPGNLARAETYRDATAAADVIVHTALEYSPDGAENLELDLQSTRALLRGRRLIYTSNAYRPRCETERAVLDAGSANSALRF